MYIGLLAAAPELRNVGRLVIVGAQLCQLMVGRLACHAGHPHSVRIVSTSALHVCLVLQGELCHVQKKCHVVRTVCSLSEPR